MNKRAIISIIIVVLVGILDFFLGFKAGTHSVEPVTTVKTVYVPGPTLQETVIVGKPIKETIPPDTISIIQSCIRDGIYTELFPTKVQHDTISYIPEDSLTFIRDWMTERTYKKQLFQTDTTGTLDVDILLKYNRLQSLSYTYTPVTKVEETQIIKKQVYEPFTGIGVLRNSVLFEIGTFYNDLSVSFLGEYNYIDKQMSPGLSVKYKF